MQLSPKALNALASIKAELLSTQALEKEVKDGQESVIITLSRPKKEPKSTIRMRHARTRGEAFQRMCRRGDWAAPRY